MKKFVLTAALIFSFGAQTAFSSPLWDIQNGIDMINNNNYQGAAKFFEGYVSSSPNDSDGHYYLGLCYKNLGRLNESAYHLQKSYELSRNIQNIKAAPAPVDTQEAENTEDDYLDMAYMYYDVGNLQKALQYANLIEHTNPNNTEGLLLKTKIYYAQRNPEMARIYFKKALLLDNSLLNSIWAKNLDVTQVPAYDFDYYNTKGLEYYYSANPSAAIDYFNKAAQLEPKSASVYNNLALCYMKLNNMQNAKAMLDKALRADRNYNLTYINYAKLEAQLDRINKKTGENKRRESYLQKALKVNPNSKFAYLELGNYYFENGMLEKAVENFKNATLIDDKFYEAYMGLGRSFVEYGNLQEGLKALKKASALNKGSGKNPDMLYYMAKICILDNRFDEAKGYLLDAINANENPNFYFELGKIYFSEEDYSSARNAFTRAMELDLDFELEADIYNYLGLIEYKSFDTQKAVYMFKKAIELDNKRAMYLYNLAQAYKSLGDNSAYSKEINAIAGLTPKTAQDFVDFSTIYYDKKNPSGALRFLDEGISKYPKERILYEAKLKLYKALKDTDGIRATENEIRAKFGK